MSNFPTHPTDVPFFDASNLHLHGYPGPVTSLKRKRSASAPLQQSSVDGGTSLEERVLACTKFSDQDTQSTPDTSIYTALSPKSSTSSTKYTTLPLTKENLQLVTMAGSQENAKSTTNTTTTLGAKNISMIRDYFKSNKIFIGDKNALNRYPELRNEVEGIVGRDRHLVMDDESWGRIENTIEEYKDYNELTFLVNVWMQFFPAVRKARPGDQSEHAGVTLGDMFHIENPTVWTERAWNEDFLCVTWGANFNSESINTLLQPTDAKITKIFNLQPRLKTPRPDLAFGLKQGAFTDDERDVALYLGAKMQPGLYHPFFALEAKNENGTLGEAEIQCCRAGAAMVYCRRKFNREARKPNEVQPPGADLHSFVFTVALLPHFAVIYAHWAEVGAADSAISYYMNRVGSYNMQEKEGANGLRQAIYNVLDWGLFARKKEILEICDTIIENDSPLRKKKKTFSM